MKGKRVLLVVMAGAVLVWAGQALAAGLLASNHNMIARYNYSGAAAKKGACSFCHIPHGAGAKLFGDNISTTGLSGDWSTDTIGQICFQCHGGVSNLSGAKNVTVFDGGVAHSNIIASANLSATEQGTITSPAIHGVAGGKISCVSCHDVHNNAIRPFLRSYSGTVEGGNLQSLCVKCHNDRTVNADTGTRIQHPTGIALASGTRSNILAKGTVPAEFKSTWSPMDVEISTAGGSDHWNLGAKFLTVVNTEGSTFNCGTCHAVHNNDNTTAGFAVGDGLLSGDVADANNSPGNALQPVSNGPTFVTDNTAEPMCKACHATTAGSGPGLATTFSHSWGTQTTSTVWPSGLTGVNYTANGAQFGINGSERSLNCQACHDMHYAGKPATTATGNTSDNYALLRNECSDCHSTGTMAGHHPSGITLTVGTNVDTLNVGIAPTWSVLDSLANETDRQALVEGSAAVRNAGSGTYPTAAGNVMTCGTCHATSFAHNVATAWVPGVTGGNTESGMCIDCHSINPSEFTANGGTGAAPTNVRGGTHWLGAVITPNYAWKAGAQNEAITPEKYTPKYGAAGTNGSIICESCHTLKFKASGAPASSNNTSDGEDSTSNAVGLLLTKSGNALGSTSYDNASTLCTACHGAAPGTGTTHPVLPTGTAAASSYIQTIEGANDNVSLTTVGTANQVNCESCHRPHDAATSGYSRILETASGQVATYLNETVLCMACHGDAIPAN